MTAESGELWAEVKGWFDKVGGYIPHSALAELGIRLSEGTTWFTKEQSEAIHAHPRWEPCDAKQDPA